MLAALLLLADPAAAADVTLDLSARLLDPDGVPVTDGPHAVGVALFPSESSGAAVWSGSVAVNTEGGFFSADVGAGSPHLDTAHLLDERWLELSVDGGTPLAPRQRVAAVPRAAVTDVTLGVRIATAAPACAAGSLGHLYYDQAEFSLKVCTDLGSGARWLPIATSAVRLVEQSGARRWSDGSVARHCEAYRRPAAPYYYDGATGSGVYRINPGSGEYSVYCDMDMDSGGWTYVAEPGRSTTNPADTTISAPSSYHRYQYDLRGMTYDKALVKRPAGYYWCNSWGTDSTAWTQPGTTSMGIAYDTSTFHYHNGNTTPYAWIQQPYSYTSSCSSCWTTNNTTPSPVGFQGLDGATGAVVRLDPPGTPAALEISNFDAFIGQAGGCNLSAGREATWQAFIR